jgi:hypothetical protein
VNTCADVTAEENAKNHTLVLAIRLGAGAQ